MIRFRDLRLGVKQWVGFGAMLLIMALMSAFAIVQLDRLRTAIDEINARTLPSTIALSAINLDVSTLRIYQLQFELTPAEDARTALSAQMAVLIDSINANRDVFERLAASAPRLDAFDAVRDSLYDRFDGYWDDYQGQFMELLFGATSSNDRAASLLTEAGPTYLALSRTLEALIDVNKRRAAFAALQVQENSRRSRRIIVLLLFVTIVGSSLLAAALIRSVTRPIRRLQEAAGAVARGQLDVQLDVDADDEIGSLSASFNRMTDSLATAQQQLLMKEKMASLGQLTAGIAHEIKNPLNFVNNFAELTGQLAEEIDELLNGEVDALPPAAREQLTELLADLRLNARKIAEHGRRADGIVRGMLLHSRGKQGERRPTPVNAFVDENIKLAYHGMRALKPDMQVALNRTFDPSLGDLSVVPQDMSRVLINLLNNAFYAVGQRHAADAAMTPRVDVVTRDTGDGVEIVVSDNGVGIPEAVARRIFEPFFTTKPPGEGTGLGLSLSYEIVTQEHGGTLEMESAEGEGATFRLWVPYEAP